MNSPFSVTSVPAKSVCTVATGVSDEASICIGPANDSPLFPRNIAFTMFLPSGTEPRVNFTTAQAFLKIKVLSLPDFATDGFNILSKLPSRAVCSAGKVVVIILPEIVA